MTRKIYQYERVARLRNQATEFERDKWNREVDRKKEEKQFNKLMRQVIGRTK